MALRLTWKRFRIPFLRPVRTAHGLWTEREGLWVRLENAAGRAGFGECCPIEAFGTGSVDDAERELVAARPAVEEQRWREEAELGGCVRYALATAEAALDEVALGEGAGAASARAWPVAGLLPAGRGALEVLRPQIEAGFRTFKWKVGVGDLADELALLDDVLAQLPERAQLRLDANGAWSRRQAERWLERCADRPIELVEQPIAPDVRGAEDLLRGLAADYPTRLGLDESLVTPGDLDRWLASGWPGVWVVKLALLGAPDEVLPRLRAAQADVVFSSALETRVGARAALRAAFAWTGERRPLGYGVWPLFAAPIYDGPPRVPFIRVTDLSDAGAELWTLGAEASPPPRRPTL